MQRSDSERKEARPSQANLKGLANHITATPAIRATVSYQSDMSEAEGHLGMLDRKFHVTKHCNVKCHFDQ